MICCVDSTKNNVHLMRSLKIFIMHALPASNSIETDLVTFCILYNKYRSVY